jgi:predicted CoA-binding protein
VVRLTIAVKNATDEEVTGILRKYRTIAVIGMSKNPEKDAYSIPAYMKKKGYRIIPVNPSADEILGEKSYKRLGEVPDQVDIVDVFRPSEDVPNYVSDVLAKKPKVFWLQLGIENESAEEKVSLAGIKVVYNKCLMQEHRRLIGS